MAKGPAKGKGKASAAQASSGTSKKKNGSYTDMIVAAIAKIAEESGNPLVSRQKIVKYLEKEFQAKSATAVKSAFAKLLENNQIEAEKSSFHLPGTYDAEAAADDDDDFDGGSDDNEESEDDMCCMCSKDATVTCTYSAMGDSFDFTCDCEDRYCDKCYAKHEDYWTKKYAHRP